MSGVKLETGVEWGRLSFPIDVGAAGIAVIVKLLLQPVGCVFGISKAADVELAFTYEFRFICRDYSLYSPDCVSEIGRLFARGSVWVTHGH